MSKRAIRRTAAWTYTSHPRYRHLTGTGMELEPAKPDHAPRSLDCNADVNIGRFYRARWSDERNHFAAPRTMANRAKRSTYIWPRPGPPLLWTAQPVGLGYSSVAVSDGRVGSIGDVNDEQRVIALVAGWLGFPGGIVLSSLFAKLGSDLTGNWNQRQGSCHAPYFSRAGNEDSLFDVIC